MLNNGRKSPVIFSAACSAGYFDHPDSDCFGEKMLKAQNGAIGFFGASRTGGANMRSSLPSCYMGQ